MRSRSGAADFMAVLLCSAVFSAGGWLFWTGFTRAIAPPGAARIGTLTFKVKSAQRKYTDRAVWEALPVNAPLYSYDSIRTAEGSTAILKLDNGAEVFLEENSLILLDYDSRKRNIEFVYGSMHAGGPGDDSPSAASGAASAAGALTISSKGSKVEVGKGKANISASKEGGLGVTVTSGSVDLLLEGASREIKENEKAEVAAGAKSVTVESIPLSISFPSVDYRAITFDAAAELRFAWKSGSPMEGFLLEVSPSPAFSSIAASAEAAGNELALSLPPGDYFARVTGKPAGAGTSTSAPVRFHVIRENPPEAVNPPDGALYSFRSVPPPIRFIWQSSALASSYLLELSPDASFAAPAASVRTESGQATVDGLQAGEYWWRVRPAYAFGFSGFGPPSKALRFSLRKTSELAAAEAFLPLDGQLVYEKAFKEAGLRFSWRTSPEAQSSTLVFYRKDDPREPVLSVDSRATSLDLNAGLGAGEYLWQVHSLAADGVAAPPSSPRSFSITDKTPGLSLSEPPEGAERDALPETPVRFAWESEAALSYSLEISKDASFSDPVTRRTAASSVEIPGLEAGLYQWRVTALDPKGVQLSRSEARRLVLLPPLGSPRIELPADGSVLELVNAPGIDFGWQPVAEAQSYSLRILDQAGKGVFSRAGIAATSFRLEDLSALKPGKYAVELRSVRAGQADQRSSAPSSSAFSISRITRLSPPSLLSPADGASIGELDMRRSGIEFSWKNDPGLPKARFALSSDPGFRQVISEESPEAARTRISRLEPGVYYWTVSGIDEAGRSYPSAPRSFEVKKAPALQAPAMAFPRAGQKVDMSARDALPFEWKPAQGATHYSIKLANKKTGAAVAAIDALKATRWEFSDLSKLDVGAFSFTIQSLVLDKDGRIERRGQADTVDFEIILSEAPGAPRILSPDTMYVP